MSFIRLKKQHMIFCQCIFLTPTELLPMKLVPFFSSLMVSVWPEFSDCVFLREVLILGCLSFLVSLLTLIFYPVLPSYFRSRDYEQAGRRIRK